jgi:peptidoglycan hydrolase-like protein with peptidoglycan-binding domain
MRLRGVIVGVLVFAIVALAAPAAAAAAGVTNPQIAGLQVALRAHGLYKGSIDGIAGPQTAAAVRRFQHKAELEVDGIAGIRTRVALGRLGRPLLGRRVLKQGMVGWDVSVLQFLLQRKGFGCSLDGRFDAMTTDGVRRFQKRARLVSDGVVGPKTLRKLDPKGAARVRDLERRRVSGPARPRVGPRYVVKPGDSLAAIAARYGTSVDRLARLNRFDPRRVLLIGTRLRLPVGAGSRQAPSSVRVRLDHWARHYGLDPSLVRALAWQESGYQSHVVSQAGAFGVMQVTEATWRFVEDVLLGRSVPRTADGNIRVGTLFLRHLLREFRGDERLALAAYYQGPKAVREEGVHPLTRRYVANVLALRTRV